MASEVSDGSSHFGEGTLVEIDMYYESVVCDKSSMYSRLPRRYVSLPSLEQATTE